MFPDFSVHSKKPFIKNLNSLLPSQECLLTILIMVLTRGWYRGSRDTGYLPFYFQGYLILSILLPGIWDTMFNFRDTSIFPSKYTNTE